MGRKSKDKEMKLLAMVHKLSNIVDEHGLDNVYRSEVESLLLSHKEPNPPPSMDRSVTKPDDFNNFINGDNEKLHSDILQARTINMEYIKSRVQELNSLIENDKLVQQQKKGSNIRQFSEINELAIVFYRNGIVVDDGPFRPYSWTLTKSFLRDIFDGYFPYEFKNKYPDGVRIKVIDMSSADYTKGDENLKDAVKRTGGNRKLPSNVKDINLLAQKNNGQLLSKEEYLKKLPSTVVVDGKIVSIRNDIGRMLNAGHSSIQRHSNPMQASTIEIRTECSLGQTLPNDEMNPRNEEKEIGSCKTTCLRVRFPQVQGFPMSTLMITMCEHEMIGYLDRVVRRQLIKILGARLDCVKYELRSFPSHTYPDTQQTLIAAGLTSRAALFCHIIAQ